jgi:hypothetical protein
VALLEETIIIRQETITIREISVDILKETIVLREAIGGPLEEDEPKAQKRKRYR